MFALFFPISDWANEQKHRRKGNSICLSNAFVVCIFETVLHI